MLDRQFPRASSLVRQRVWQAGISPHVYLARGRGSTPPYRHLNPVIRGKAINSSIWCHSCFGYF